MSGDEPLCPRSRYLNTARRYVATFHQALLSPSPEEIVRCLPGLAEAATCLGQIEASFSTEAADSAFVADLRALQRDLKMIGRMIEHSSRFYRGWASVLGAAAGGYTQSGRAAEIAVAGTIAVRG